VWDEESGVLHRELEGFGAVVDCVLASFLSGGLWPRLVAAPSFGHVRVYDPEAGSVLHRLDGGHTGRIRSLACIASSSAAPHHPRLVSASEDGAVKVWDGETGEWLADLRGQRGPVTCVAVWKEHHTGHDRIAVAGHDGHVRVWDGEAFTLLHDLRCGGSIRRVSAFRSAEGPARLLVAPIREVGLQEWDPEEGRLLHDGINQGGPLHDYHLLESAQGRHLLAIVGVGPHHSRHPDGMYRTFLDVWNLGEAPAPDEQMRPANKQG
jgi:WD40 repeat protein